MTLTNIRFPEDNPFARIKVRQIFGWLLLLYMGIYFQIVMIGYIMGVKFDSNVPLDPLASLIFGIYLLILTLALVWRQCKLVGIEIKYLIGKVPDRYQWLSLVGLAIASVVFSIGISRIFYYYLSFILPSFVEKILSDGKNSSILITASKTFYPALYYLIYGIYLCVITPIYLGFIVIAIMLHRWSMKWGNTPAIVAICLLNLSDSYSSFVYIIISILITTILYAKTCSLVVVITFMALRSISFIIWNFYQALLFDNQTANILDIYRSQIQLGVLFFALSAPWVIGFIYKNWSVLKGPLPYFANAAEAEKIKADSET